MNDKTWPTDNPKNCPPIEAFPSEEIYYRVVKSTPPSRDSFLRWIDEPWNRKKKLTCPRCSVSMHSDLEQAKKFLKRFGPRFRKSNPGIVKLKLRSDAGVIKQSGTDISHHDFWGYDGLDYLPLLTKIN